MGILRFEVHLKLENLDFEAASNLLKIGQRVAHGNPEINAQDFGRKMKKTIPIEKFYTAVFFLLKQNIIFFNLMAYPSQEKVHCFLCEDL